MHNGKTKTGTEALENILMYASDQGVNKILSASDQNHENRIIKYLESEGNNTAFLSKYIDNVLIRWDANVNSEVFVRKMVKQRRNKAKNEDKDATIPEYKVSQIVVFDPETKDNIEIEMP